MSKSFRRIESVKLIVIYLIFLTFVLFFPASKGWAKEGFLQVTISPQEAIDAGAKWSIQDPSLGPFSSGYTLRVDLGSDNNKDLTIVYKDIAGWETPNTDVVKVQKDKTKSIESGVYEVKEDDDGDDGDDPVTVELENWTNWPLPSGTPHYWEGPLSFSYLNRNYMAYITFAEPDGNDIQSDSYYDEDYWWSGPQWWFDSWGTIGEDKTIPAPSKVWGSFLTLVESNLEQVSSYIAQFPSSRIIYVDNEGSTSDISSYNSDELNTVLRKKSVIPNLIDRWFVQSDDVWKNQYFKDDSDWTSDWRDYLLGTSNKNGLAMEDSGHGTPVIIWPDNTWIKTMEGYSSYESQLSSYYNNWGGAVLFQPTNEGLLHAFTTVHNNKVEEKWSFLSTPALKLSIYKEYLRKFAGVSGLEMPRLNILGGPITVNDIEKTRDTSEDNIEWRRLVVGTTGEETYLKFKERNAWGKAGEKGVALPENVTTSNLYETGISSGIYALDVTNPDSPKEIWTLHCANFPSGNYYDISVNGSEILSSDHNFEKYSYCGDIKMILCRPFIGYTNKPGTNGQVRIWHSVFVGVDHDNEYHVWDVNANNGELLWEKQIPGPASYTNLDYLAQERLLPTRVAPSLPEGENTPILSEVYIHFSTGDFYKFNFQTDPENNNEVKDPKHLIRITYKETGTPNLGAAATHDFDVTLIETETGIHRFVALPVQIEKEGNWIGGGGIRNALVVIDLTKLEKDRDLLEAKETGSGYPYNIDLDPSGSGDGDWGGGWGDEANNVQTNEYGSFLFLAVEKQQDEMDTISAPIWYDNHLVFASTGLLDEGKKKETYYSRFYVVDPFTEGEPMGGEVPGEAFVGGALIDQQGRLLAPTGDGGSSEIDLTSDEYGALSPIGSSSGVDAETGIIYWQVE